jgi:hypothetical protein
MPQCPLRSVGKLAKPHDLVFVREWLSWMHVTAFERRTRIAWARGWSAWKQSGLQPYCSPCDTSSTGTVRLRCGERLGPNRGPERGSSRSTTPSTCCSAPRVQGPAFRHLALIDYAGGYSGLNRNSFGVNLHGPQKRASLTPLRRRDGRMLQPRLRRGTSH